MLVGIQLQFQHAPYVIRFVAVDQQLQTLLGEGVLLLAQHALQAQQAFVARQLGPGDGAFDALLQGQTGGQQHITQRVQGAQEYLGRGLQQHCTDRPTQHDNQRRTVEQGVQLPAFQPVAAQQGEDADADAQQAEAVHLRFRPAGTQLADCAGH